MSAKNNNNERILLVKKPGHIISGIIVAILACALVYSIATNPRFEWAIVWKYIFNEN
ncbi:ABC transporter permease, partial [Gardnerella vaginalis]